MKLARELGEIKVLVARRKTIRPRPGGEGHWRCETCGTVTHAREKPERCPECGLLIDKPARAILAARAW